MSLIKRLAGIFRQRELDTEIEDELRSHIEMRSEELIASGVPADEARLQARRAFGNSTFLKEEARSFDTVRWLETFGQDVRYGMRQLLRHPGFTLVAALTLALGIGANTAIFTAVNAILLRPLPYGTPSELVALKGSQSLPDVVDVTAMAKAISTSGAWANWAVDLVSEGPPEQIDAALIGGDLFQTLGVAPYLGSVFDEQDDLAGKHVAVARYEFWQTHLGGDRAAIGRQIQLSGISYTVIGVMPRAFHLPNSTSQLWIPFRVGYPEAASARGAHFMTAIARLRPEATVGQLNAELVAIGKRLGEMYPEEARTFGAVGARERFTGEVRTPLLVLLGAVSLVLLIACSNFATLLLARGASRGDEMQIRSALGARPLRIVRQLLTESTLLSLVGGALGIAFAYASMRALMTIIPDDTRKLYEVSLDPTALAFTLAVCVATGLIFGALPAFHAVRDRRLLSTGARASHSTGARRVLVISEVALALMLLTGAGLLMRSLWELQNVSLGMQPEGVLTMRLVFPATRYGPIPVQEQFLSQLEENLKAVPGLESAAFVSELPLSGWRMMHNMIVEGQAPVAPGQEPEIYTHEISPNFFSTVGTKFVAGRDFSAQDRAHAPLVAIVNEAFARQYLSERAAIGSRARWARVDPAQWMTIVGVVRDVRFESLEDPQEPTIYTPYTQKQQVWKRFTAIVVRPRPGAAGTVAQAVKQAVWALDPQLPVTHVQPMTEVMRESMQQRRLVTLLLTAFAGLAVALAMMGVYGVISYLVTQRRQEVGIRIALGAQRLDILWMMVRQGLPLLGIGIVLGSAGALASTRVLHKLLYGITATDLPTFAAVALLLALVALVAIAVPARRATRTDPVIALRSE